MICDKLMPVAFTALCSPDFIARHGPFDTPADLLRAPLLEPRDPWWPIWCRAAGIDPPAPQAAVPVSFDIQAVVGAAAVAGQGAAILTPAFFTADLAAGRLVQPFPIQATDDMGYWLVYPEFRRNVRKIRVFRDWILAEAAAQ
jgi:LysR family glycine cleavage system transcriptional activator